MASQYPFREKRRTSSIDDSALTDIIKKRLAPKKGKGVRFTWEGAKNLTKSLLGNQWVKSERYEAIQEKNAKEKDYIDFFEDIEKAVHSGTQKLGYAIGDVITTGIDLGAAADITIAGKKIKEGKETELTEKLTEAYEENKVADPETLLGKVTDILIQYGIPGGAVFKVLNRVKRLAGMQKLRMGARALAGERITNIASKAGYMATAFSAMDYIASEPDRPNLVLKKEDTAGLGGSDLAAARFRNRLRFGAEGAAIGTLWSLMGKPAALGFKYGIYKPAAFAAGVGLKTANAVVVNPASWLLSKDPYVIPAISRNLQKGTNFTLQ